MFPIRTQFAPGRLPLWTCWGLFVIQTYTTTFHHHRWSSINKMSSPQSLAMKSTSNGNTNEYVGVVFLLGDRNNYPHIHHSPMQIGSSQPASQHASHIIVSILVRCSVVRPPPPPALRNSTHTVRYNNLINCHIDHAYSAIIIAPIEIFAVCKYVCVHCDVLHVSTVFIIVIIINMWVGVLRRRAIQFIIITASANVCRWVLRVCMCTSKCPATYEEQWRWWWWFSKCKEKVCTGIYWSA